MAKLIKTTISHTDALDKKSSIVYLNPEFISSISVIESGGIISNKVSVKMSNGSDFVVEKTDLANLIN